MFIENNINENCFIKQMTTILCVEKLGSIKEVKVKNVIEEELYKKAGLKTGQDFQQQTTWKVKSNKKMYNICVYGKTKGRANTENKYDFPPPIDNALFFGNCIIVNKDDEDSIVSLTTNEWNKIYEELFGGFEDIGNENSEEESEDEDENIPKTKSGYAKDGFIVDDDDDDDDTEEYTSDSEAEKPSKTKSPTRRKLTNKMSISIPTNVFDVETEIDLDFIDELQEEEYV